jgi:hypothetical protein
MNKNALRCLPAATLAVTLWPTGAAGAFKFECKADLAVGYWFDENNRAWVTQSFRAGRRLAASTTKSGCGPGSHVGGLPQPATSAEGEGSLATC